MTLSETGDATGIEWVLERRNTADEMCPYLHPPPDTVCTSYILSSDTQRLHTKATPKKATPKKATPKKATPKELRCKGKEKGKYMLA